MVAGLTTRLQTSVFVAGAALFVFVFRNKRLKQGTNTSEWQYGFCGFLGNAQLRA